MANYMYLTDPLLVNKISLFKDKGVANELIAALIERGILTEPLEVITKKLETIELNGEQLNSDNINLLKKDLETYYKRIELLRGLGIELDANETRNNLELIIKTPYLEQDIEVLKNYMVRIVRKNGKYALDIFWKNPNELASTIDALIENSLDNIIVNNPEIMALDCEEFLKRVKYCQNNNISYYNRDRENAETIVVSPLDFYKTYPNINLDEMPSLDNNAKIAQLLSNEYVNNLVNSLNTYYMQPNSLSTEVQESKKAEISNLISMFEQTLKAEVSSPNAYTIEGVLISKKKLERNLAILLDTITKEGTSLQGIEKEIILTAALHNLKASEEAMQKIANTAINFNQSVGGPTL